MEPSEIVNVLARASELQTKIDGAIRRASLAHTLPSHRRSFNHESFDDDDDHDAEDEERSFPDVQKLKAIRDALFDLQDQLDFLQALQKRQKFGREDLLVELEDKRKLLLKRLRDYNGKEWEIVQEAHAFVGEPVQKEEDLMLPPYQSSVRDVHVLGEGGSLGGLSKRRHSLSRRASLASRPEEEEVSGPKQVPEDSLHPVSEKSTRNETPFSGFVFGIAKLAARAGEVVRLSAKSALVIASVIFTLSQLEPQLRKWSADRPSNLEIHNRSSRRQHIKLSPLSKSSGLIVQDKSCPPGKVLLVQDGVQKCFVKERIEAPFKEVVKQPDASYGYG